MTGLQAVRERERESIGAAEGPTVTRTVSGVVTGESSGCSPTDTPGESSEDGAGESGRSVVFCVSGPTLHHHPHDHAGVAEEPHFLSAADARGR